MSHRLSKWTRAERYPPFAIGRPKHQILEAIGRYHYLSAPQLTRLLFTGRVHKYVQEHLKDLFHGGYLCRLPLWPPTPHGSPLAIYGLDQAGSSYLKAAGLAPAGRLKPTEERRREQLFLRHTLLANDLLIAAQLLPRQVPAMSVAAMRTERELKRTPAYVRLGKERVGVIPDGWVDLRLDGSQSCIAFELDTGTEHRQAFRSKIRGLVAYAEGPYEQLFETSSLTIAVVAPGPVDRVRELLAWTQDELVERQAVAQADLFRFTSLDPSTTPPAQLFFAPVWHRPFSSEPLALLELDLPSG